MSSLEEKTKKLQRKTKYYRAKSSYKKAKKAASPFPRIPIIDIKAKKKKQGKPIKRSNKIHLF
jgi:hypothetical protein